MAYKFKRMEQNWICNYCRKNECDAKRPIHIYLNDFQLIFQFRPMLISSNPFNVIHSWFVDNYNIDRAYLYLPYFVFSACRKKTPIVKANYKNIV